MSWRQWVGLAPRLSDLARTLVRRFERAGLPGWTFEPQARQLRGPNGGVLALDNLYLEFRQAARRDRPALIEKYVGLAEAQAHEVPKLWTLAQRQLFPVLRSRYDLDLHALQARAEGIETFPACPSRVLAGDVCVRLAYDHGNVVSHVNDEQLETWGQTFDDALDCALANLAALPKPGWVALDGGVFRLHSECSYEETYLLLDKVRAQLAFERRAIYMPCNRGWLLAADADDADAVRSLISCAGEALRQAPWPQTATVLQRQGTCWQPYSPGGAAAAQLAEIQIVELASVYQQQKDALERIDRQSGVDRFVASFGLMRHARSGGAVKSYCTWTEGIESSLPKTDLVVLGRGDPESASWTALCVPWDEIERLCGSRLEAEPLVPPRFAVVGFPDDAEWESLIRLGEVLKG